MIPIRVLGRFALTNQAGGSQHGVATGQAGRGGQVGDPASFRREMGVKPGDTLIVEMDGGELRVRSLPSAIQRVQARMRELNPEGRLLSDELIADRRAEAARE